MEYMAILGLCFSIIALTFVAYDFYERKECLKTIADAEISIADTTRLLGETHNAIVKAQKSIVDRLEILETRTSALATSLPQRRN